MDKVSRAAVAAALAATAVACGATPSPRSSAGAATDLILTGRVVSAATRGPLVGAQVMVVDGASSGREATTDSTGTYRLEGLTPGGFTVRAVAGRYRDASQPVTLPGPARADFALHRVPCDLARCGPQATECAEALPLFEKPFDGEHRVTNLFDHRFPRWTSDPDDGFASYCGGANRGRINGHQGYDWIMSEGTPLLAVADARVRFAGFENPFPCPLLDREVAALYVDLEMETPHGETLRVQYLHLSQLLVTSGQTVRTGEAIGLSGNTGCSTGPHLHLQVVRSMGNTPNRPVLTDPYGWQGEGSDPWASDPQGTASAWLWLAAPRLSLPGVVATAEESDAVIQDMNNVTP